MEHYLKPYFSVYWGILSICSMQCMLYIYKSYLNIVMLRHWIIQQRITVETLYGTIYYSKYFMELNFDKSTLYVSLWTPHTSPFRESYGVSFMRTITEIGRVIKGFCCILINRNHQLEAVARLNGKQLYKSVVAMEGVIRCCWLLAITMPGWPVKIALKYIQYHWTLCRETLEFIMFWH